ncbi:ABC transporter ATP-binding protein [Hathewaya massiliensis]|uniref:ABC transporter ATP-binding protein n=1 Tax=Hathewaya massiliensis TaxID=1964382 RepID=UPI00115B67D6|nr:ABC transporter ATP-binding protein [Hathewaya massiliensis]
MIEIKNLKKAFSKKVLFENVNINLEDGKIYGFVGPNGVGKSIFFKTISGLMKYTEGQVVCNNKILHKDIDYLENLGYMDNNAHFIKDLTGFENLKLLASIKSEISSEHIKEYMIRLGLDPDSNTKVKDYSLGMYQKLAIIQAVMENPNIIIFDEPFNGLDKKSCVIVKEMILSLKAENKIILITSHILNDIEEVADEVYEFVDQKIVKV